MAVHTVSVEGGPAFPCPDDRPILVVAWEQGVMLPFSCRPSRAGLLVQGRWLRALQCPRAERQGGTFG
jgi:hypothetical protein